MNTTSLSGIVPIAIIIILIILTSVYMARHRNHSAAVFIPKAAWLRAGICFCASYLVAVTTGVFDALLTNPIGLCRAAR